MRLLPPFLLIPARSIVALALLLAVSLGAAPARAADPRGVWLVDQKAAVRIFDCGATLCGRIVWLDEPRDQAGEVKRDRRNPDPSLRQRTLCGLDVLSGLRGAGPDAWEHGSFYNPQDGHRYDTKMQMRSENEMVARFFVGMPLLGESKVLRRIAGGERLDSACPAGTMTASAGQ